MAASTSTSTTSGVKRGLAALLGGGAEPTPALLALFQGVSDLFIMAPSMDQDAVVGEQFFEFVTKDEAVRDHRLILIPANGNASWSGLVHGDLAVFVVKVDLTGTGEGLVLRHIGITAGGESSVPMAGEWCFKTVPDSFVTTKPSMNGVPTIIEELVANVVEKCVTQGGKQNLGATSTSGTTGMYGDVVKKYAGCKVQDLNGAWHDILNKEGAAKRVEQLSVLIREMLPERREILCPDLTFTTQRFWSECLRHMERKMADTDPMFSIARVKELLHLPVCQDMDIMRHHLLEGHEADNWTRSLWDFVPGDKGWTSGLEVQGKQHLLRAFETWLDFQCAFKGPAFGKVLAPVVELFKDQGRILEPYGGEYIWAQLEWMIRDYRYEVVSTRGPESKMRGKHAIVNQDDCVTFLSALVAELVREARSGGWERYPHTIFYAPGSQFNLVKKPTRGGAQPGGAGAGTVTTGGQVRRDGEHQFGVCMWSVAGALKMISKRENAPYKCQDVQRTHASLKSIPIGTMRALLKDPSFMCCRSERLKKELAEKVEENQHRFAK